MGKVRTIDCHYLGQPEIAAAFLLLETDIRLNCQDVAYAVQKRRFKEGK